MNYAETHFFKLEARFLRDTIARDDAIDFPMFTAGLCIKANTSLLSPVSYPNF